jgi:hypothetical protein
LTVTRQIQSDDLAARVDATQLCEGWAPHAPIEGQPVEQNQWRLPIELTILIRGEAGETPRSGLCVLLVHALIVGSCHLHDPTPYWY